MKSERKLWAACTLTLLTHKLFYAQLSWLLHTATVVPTCCCTEACKRSKIWMTQTSYDASKVKVEWKFKPHSPIWELKMHYCFSLQMSYKNEGRKPVMYIYVRTIFLLVGQVICNPSLTIYTAVVGQSPWHTLHGYAGTCLCGFMYMRMCAVFLGLRGGRQNDRKEDKLRWPPSSSPLLYLFNLPVWPMGHVFAMLCTWQWERSNKFKLQMLQVEQRLMKELCLCVAWWQMWCVSKEWIQRSLFKDVVWLVSRKNSTCKGTSLFFFLKKRVLHQSIQAYLVT